MHSWTIVKLTCCVIIWTTLIVDYSSCADVDPRVPYNQKSPPPSISTTKAQGDQSHQSMQSKEHSGQSTADSTKPANNSNQKIPPPNSQNITNGKDAENIAGSNHLSGEAQSLRQPTTVEIRTEESSTFKSVYIYITVGILCVAAFNVYMFWYRKRTTTYSFTPPTAATTSRARR